MCRLEEELDKDAVYHQFCSTFAANALPRKLWMGLETALIRHTVQPFTESDDTRCCDNTICPPEDGHVDARNISRIIM